MNEEDYHLILDEYAVDWIPYILHIRNGVVVSYYEYPTLAYRENTNNADPTADAAAAFLVWLENEQK